MTHTSSIAKDPFTLVYTALVDNVLKGHRPLVEMMKAGNWISFHADEQDPEKNVHADSDSPELKVYPTGAPLIGKLSSSKTQIETAYAIELFTGDSRTKDKLHPLLWEILRALEIGDRPDKNLYSHQLVNVRLQQPIEIELSHEEFDDRGRSNGWFARVAISLLLVIPTKQLLAKEPKL